MNIGGNGRRMMKGSRNRERERENNGESDREKAERKEKNRGAERTCQYIIPRHSGKPSEDKDKDVKKARRKKRGHH